MRFAAVDRKPSGIHEHFPFRLEGLRLNARDAGRHQIFSGRIEHRKKTLDDHVVELRFDFAQMLGAYERRDDGEVIRYLRVVENTAVGLHPFPLQDFARESAVGVRLGERFHRRADRRQIILGQRS